MSIYEDYKNKKRSHREKITIVTTDAVPVVMGLCNISIMGGLPLVLVDDYTIGKAEKVTTVVNTDPICHLSDPDFLTKYGVERFTYMGTTSVSATIGRISMYYDAAYQDVLVIPRLPYLELTGGTYGTINIRGYVIGTSGNDSGPVGGLLSFSNEACVPLPVPTTVVGDVVFDSHAVLMDGVISSPKKAYREITNTASNIGMYDASMVDIIELGLADTLFTGVDADTRIPVSAVYQNSTTTFMTNYLGNIPIAGKKLYLLLP